MQSKDLRIGNYIKDTFDVKKYEVRQLELEDFSAMLNYKISKHRNTYNPVELNDEWLVKFGFEKYEFDHKENQYRYKDRLIVLRDGKFVDYGSSVILQYVHELQNLYYAITGVELLVS